MSRRTLAVFLSVAAVLGVVIGVGGVQAAVVGPPAPVVAGRWQLDALYLAKTRERGVEATDSELLLTARGVCNQAEQGRPLSEMADYVQRRHRVSYADGVFVVALAVHTRCPKYVDAIGE